MSEVKIESSWKKALEEEFAKPYFQQLVDFIKKEKAAGKVIYPPGPFIFNAFDTTPFDTVKVIILGQDPYHNPEEAMGLCFSVPKGVRMPPSLQNIFKELQNDLGITMPNQGDLTHWAKQGVFLLNAMLTVEKNKPASHSTIGWQNFTDAVIHRLSTEKEGLVFLLWGKFAQGKEVLIDSSKHLVLKAAHPSPFSANAGFFGCRHFSKANEYLKKKGKTPIDWSV